MDIVEDLVKGFRAFDYANRIVVYTNGGERADCVVQGMRESLAGVEIKVLPPESIDDQRRRENLEGVFYVIDLDCFLGSREASSSNRGAA